MNASSSWSISFLSETLDKLVHKPLPPWCSGLLLAFVLAIIQGQVNAAVENTPPKSAPLSTPEKPVTFVQITDMHLFDAGNKSKRKADAEHEREYNRDALHWAVMEINRLVVAGGEIDFVVFTGDFGLELVRSSAEGPPCNASEEDNFNRVKQQGWPRLESPDEAAEEVAKEFRMLRVPIVYVIPGNNDLIAEDPCDLVRYKSFVASLRRAVASPGPQIVDLTEPRNARTEYNGFKLVGLNTASFKQGDLCASRSYPGCPDEEIRQLSSTIPVDSTGSLYVIFTHIPDLFDPYPDPKCSPRCPSWRISPAQKDAWNRIARQSNVAAIFAGHFHDSDRLLYSVAGDQTPLSITPEVSRKTWVAPPLAIKYQNPDSVTARGLLLVRLQRTNSAMNPAASVAVVPFWYVAPRPRGVWSYGLLIVLSFAGTVVVLLAVRAIKLRSSMEGSVKHKDGGSIQENFAILLEKTIRLKDFALKNGYIVDRTIVRELNELADKYTPLQLSEPPDWAVHSEDVTRLDSVLARLTSITLPTTVDYLSVEPESPEYKRFRQALVAIGVGALVAEIAAFSLVETKAIPLALSNSLMAMFLGLLGSVSYSLFNVLRAIPPQAFNPRDEYYSYARLILGLLLGWVFYFAFAMDAFANLPHVIAQSKASPADVFRLLVPFLAGYSTKFVIGVIERAITAFEVALGIEDKRDVRIKRPLSGNATEA